MSDDNVMVRLDRIENYIIEIIQRLAVLEERSKAKTVLYGTLGGFIPAMGIFIWWLVGRF